MAPRLRMAPSRLVESDARPLPPKDAERSKKKVDSFYVSAAWKAFRDALREERGWRCEEPRCETPNGPWKMIYGHHIAELADAARRSTSAT
jgi:hypothetical protein